MRARSLPRSLRSSPSIEPRLTGESGGAGLLAVVAVLMFAGLGGLGLVAVTGSLTDATRARVTADLAALAAVNWGPVVCAKVVHANGGELLNIDRDGLWGAVEVRIQNRHAQGQASVTT